MLVKSARTASREFAWKYVSALCLFDTVC